MNKPIKNVEKYCIDKYINSNQKKQVLKELEISQPTFWRKSSAKIGEKDGFEFFQLKQIADILERDIFELLTLEAKIFYNFTPKQLSNGAIK